MTIDRIRNYSIQFPTKIFEKQIKKLDRESTEKLESGNTFQIVTGSCSVEQFVYDYVGMKIRTLEKRIFFTFERISTFLFISKERQPMNCWS